MTKMEHEENFQLWKPYPMSFGDIQYSNLREY